LRARGRVECKTKREPARVRPSQRALPFSPQASGGSPDYSSAGRARACAAKVAARHLGAPLTFPPPLVFTLSHHAEPAAAVARSSTNTSGMRPRALPFSASAAAAVMATRSTGRAMSAVAWGRWEGVVRGAVKCAPRPPSPHFYSARRTPWCARMRTCPPLLRAPNAPARTGQARPQESSRQTRPPPKARR